MFRILAVDDDSACLAILKLFLLKWNYEVTAVKHPHDALSELQKNSYDLVLSDVHMPDMNGFELQERVNRIFCLPVILISSDNQAELKGIQNGAVYFMIKPIRANDVKYIWQFSIWWKKKVNDATPPIRTVNVLSSSGNISDTGRTRKAIWSRRLHTRFVEALLVLGYHEAAPRDILNVMNVAGLITREQVGSHLQKYRLFIQRILNGDEEINMSHWIDMDSYSSVFDGNPHLMLINQIKDTQRTGKKSSSRGGVRILPPFNPAEDSLKMNMDLMGMPTDYASSSVNATALGLDISSFGNAGNAQLGCYTQTTRMEPRNFFNSNGGSIGRAEETYQSEISSAAPLQNKLFGEQNITDGQQPGAGRASTQENWIGDDKIFSPDNFLLDPNLFTEDNLLDPNLFPEDNFLFDTNLFLGEHHDVVWDDIMNLVAEDEVAGVADAMVVENSGGNDKDVGLAENKDDENYGSNDKADENSGDDRDDKNSGDDVNDVDYNPEEDY